MSEEWVLVPAEASDEMAIVCAPYDQTAVSFYRAMLAARPPIPRPVWDAMVERAARAAQAVLESRWEDLDESEQGGAQRMAEAALRAALGNPHVEGD